MAFLDTLLVNGHDLRALPYWEVVGSIDGLRSPLLRRGEHGLIPGRRGRVPTPLVLDYYPITVPGRIYGATRGERNDNLTDLLSLVSGLGASGLVDLERRIATGAADDHLAATAPGSSNPGYSWAIINPNTGATALMYYQMTGLWSDDGGTTWTLP